MKHSHPGDPSTLQASREKLVQDIAAVAAEVADLVTGASERSLERAQDALDEARSALRDGGREVAGATRAYVQANPLQTLGFAAAAGLVVGLLLARR